MGMFDALDNETRTLDTIIADGFKRIDEAVERVIAKHSRTAIGELRYTLRGDAYFGAESDERRRAAQRKYNYEMSNMIEQAAFNRMARVCDTGRTPYQSMRGEHLPDGIFL
jgi:hypothetical protein